jgi:hypothetical protein
MPADVIESINVLSKASQSGMSFTNIWNEVYNEDEDDISDGDSDNDSDYNSEYESSDGEYDDYDDFIVRG